jgi:hypothetical protein
MVEFRGGKIKVLTSQKARESGSVNPKAQTPAGEVKGDGYRAHQDGREIHRMSL